MKIRLPSRTPRFDIWRQLWILTFWMAVTQTVFAQVIPEQQNPLSEMANIRFQNDERLFAVMAALNIAGFDAETPGEAMSDVRRAVRAELSSVDPDIVNRLKLFYDEHLRSGDEQPQIRYTSLALLLNQPPDFSLSRKEEEMPLEAWQVRDFRKLVREFYLDAQLHTLWQTYEPRYQKELDSYKEVLKDVLQQTLQYFRIPPRIVLDREIVLIPDLLDVTNIVNARNLERVYYIVVGPSESPRQNYPQLEHEYLHFLADPLVRRYGTKLLRYEEFMNTAQRQPHIRSEYQNRFLLVIGESLIESLQLRLHPPKSEDHENLALVELFRQGFIFSPYFYRGLKEYENSDLVSLPTYLEGLFSSFDESEMKKDEEFIATLEKKIRTEDEVEVERLRQAQADSERRQQIHVHLTKASDLLSRKLYEEARLETREILALDPANGNAHFYLGQIAAQLQDHDQALAHYRQSAASVSSEPWVRAWAFVRAGRILAAQHKFEDSREAFQSVLQMTGNLRGAAEEASQLLSKLPTRQP